MAFLLLGSKMLAAQTVRSKPEPPAVFLVTIDTLRADHIHCYGYHHILTPALDSLATGGILFTDAFTPAPITNVSHASILTGLQPSSHGVTAFGVPLAATHLTWAQLLQQKGYQTAAFIGSIVLDSRTLAPGFDRGFDFYDNFPEKLPAKHSQKTPRWGRVERRGLEVVNRAELWLSKHPKGPRFVWIHLYDPHDPYEPPAPFSLQYKDRLYDGEIAYADSALGNFLQFLKKKGWYQNSLIIVVGDHGEGLGEHNEQTHGIFLYDSTTHVPLIIKLPFGAQASKVIGAQVRTTDILPTALEILDVPVPAALDGASLIPLFEGAESTERVVLGETDYPMLFGWAPLRSIRRDELKYIEAPHPELYDLRADPDELRNSYQPWDARVKKSRGLLADARAQAAASGSSARVSANTLDELKALGYLGRADAGSSTSVPEPSLLPDPKDKIEEQNLLHTAMIAEDDNRLAAARDALEQTLRLEPDLPAAVQQLGELELRAGNFSQAAKDLTHAHELRPHDAFIEFDLAQALEKNGDYNAARDALEASLKLAPDQFAARLLLGKVYLALMNAPEAAEQFQAALLLKTASLEAALGLARADITRGKFIDAVQELEPVSRSYPRHAEVFDLLAQAFRETGNRKKAERAESHAKLLRITNQPKP